MCILHKIEAKKKPIFVIYVQISVLAEKERFELSRRFPALHP